MNQRNLAVPASTVAEVSESKDKEPEPKPNCCTVPPDGDGGPIKP